MRRRWFMLVIVFLIACLCASMSGCAKPKPRPSSRTTEDPTPTVPSTGETPAALPAPSPAAAPAPKTVLKPGEVLRDDFAGFNTSVWLPIKGAPRAKDGSLVLSSAPGKGEEVQSVERFKFKSLEFKATSETWPVDTSLGFEFWDGPVHRAIVVTNGTLGIIDQGKTGAKETEWYSDIPDWDSTKGKATDFTIQWTQKKVELLVNGKAAVTYDGPLIPDQPLRVRISASNDHKDVVKVDYVVVKEPGK
jgi:hypothetical protein